MKICDRCIVPMILDKKLKSHDLSPDVVRLVSGRPKYEQATCAACGEEKSCATRLDVTQELVEQYRKSV